MKTMKKQQQSPEIRNLKAQLQRAVGPQLPVIRWQNPHKVTIKSTKFVRGWGDD